MKTAVEFLVKELQLDVFANDEEMATIIKAKEMEKEQIVNAVDTTIERMNVIDNFRTLKNGEQYYNEIFKEQ